VGATSIFTALVAGRGRDANSCADAPGSAKVLAARIAIATPRRKCAPLAIGREYYSNSPRRNSRREFLRGELLKMSPISAIREANCYRMPTMPIDWSRITLLGTHPYRTMFLIFLVIILAEALIPAPFAHPYIYDYGISLLLLVALVETLQTRQQAILALVFGLPAILSRIIVARAEDSLAANSAVLALTALFMMFLIWILLRDLLRRDRPTSERIFGALTAYLFIGILFALLFAHLHYRFDGAFSIPDHLVPDVENSEVAMLPVFTYFSFVTLTTLGYGDVTPIISQARTLAWFEALIGQLYLAVMVASLVGTFIAEKTRKAQRDPPAD